MGPLRVVSFKSPSFALFTELPADVSVEGPGVMEEGAQYPLTCNIISVTPLQNLRVKWYQGNETVLIKKFNDTSVTPVNASSTLKVTAKSDLAGAHFRCEAQLHLGPNGPAYIPTVTSSPYTAAVRCEFQPILSLMQFTAKHPLLTNISDSITLLFDFR